MKTVMVTAKLNTTVVRRGQVKEVDATPIIKELIAAGVLTDVTPKPPRKKPAAKPADEESDATPDVG
jgi:hypothetical protein